MHSPRSKSSNGRIVQLSAPTTLAANFHPAPPSLVHNPPCVRAAEPHASQSRVPHPAAGPLSPTTLACESGPPTPAPVPSRFHRFGRCGPHCIACGATRPSHQSQLDLPPAVPPAPPAPRPARAPHRPCRRTARQPLASLALRLPITRKRPLTSAHTRDVISAAICGHEGPQPGAPSPGKAGWGPGRKCGGGGS